MTAISGSAKWLYTQWKKTTYWQAPLLNNVSQEESDKRLKRRKPNEPYNLECSLNQSDFAYDKDGKVIQNTEQPTHSIVLDLDCPHEYRPSSTEGHGHLIIDADMPWDQYRHLLAVLCSAGVISKSYLNHALRRHATFVRAEGVYKERDSRTSP